MHLKELTTYLDDFLNIDGINDTCFNGLQVEGKNEVKKIAFAVDACIDSFDHAIAAQADMLIVHHGQFWEFTNPSITSWNKKRIQKLLDNNISLYAAHLPLDRHKEVGNNAQLLKLLDAEINRPFYTKKGGNIGWIGKTKNKIKLADIANRLNNQLQTECIVVPFGNPDIETISVISGGGGYGGFWESLKENVDLYITGDSADIFQTAKDAQINVIFAGHYATETVGLKALAQHLHDTFNIETEFIELPTGL
ncbi:MAG: Nif3-like dinuclear metal center hexameric protein [Candidatus Dependentiae bacterium]